MLVAALISILTQGGYAGVVNSLAGKLLAHMSSQRPFAVESTLLDESETPLVGIVPPEKPLVTGAGLGACLEQGS